MTENLKPSRFEEMYSLVGKHSRPATTEEMVREVRDTYDEFPPEEVFTERNTGYRN